LPILANGGGGGIEGGIVPRTTRQLGDLFLFQFHTELIIHNIYSQIRLCKNAYPPGQGILFFCNNTQKYEIQYCLLKWEKGSGYSTQRGNRLKLNKNIAKMFSCTS
jgi:hypothetical protein